MRVRLKGLNSFKRKLRDGTTVTYWYAWKGGPRLNGEPGSPEFIAAYNAAVVEKIPVSAKSLKGIITKFEDSAQFTGLSPRTREDYEKHLDAIEREFGDMPVEGLKSKRVRVVFMEWRDRLATRSRRQADYAWTILARCLSWALDRGLVEANPCERGGRLYGGTRAEKVWSDIEEAKFLSVASPGLRLAYLLAVWTGQRQGDLLRLTWSGYDATWIRLRQSKTGCRVEIPVAQELKAALDAEKRVSPSVLTQRGGKPWTADGFSSSWRKAAKRAGIVGLTFHDLRGTAVTRLALAGCSEAEIATVTGHSLRDVRSILDAHYLNRDPRLAQSAIEKLEKRRTDFPK